jgi:tRNA-uridine 2-sulfurtransferase
LPVRARPCLRFFAPSDPAPARGSWPGPGARAVSWAARHPRRRPSARSAIPTDPLLRKALDGLALHPLLKAGDRVLAAMSGGVDSSVMAALLQRAGCEVVGISMQLFDKGKGQAGGDEAAGKCCTLDDFQDARRVAFDMGFPHYVLDLEARFQETVIEDFIQGYTRGETPSPCIKCNQHLKFKGLFEIADEMGARFVATGHYAHIQHDARGFHLLKASDPAKDQSYFLFTHTQETLARTLFPLSGFTKPEVRELGRALGLHLAEKKESQEICFVTQGRYDAYLEGVDRAPAAGPGPIRHVDGRSLGSHQGYWRYTVGQRKGLRIAFPSPLFVVRVDAATNTVFVGEEADLLGREARVRDLSWCQGPPAPSFRCTARIRSRSPEAPAEVFLEEGGARIVFDAPLRALAPGQAVVFYRDGEVLGGGWLTSGA